MTAIDNVLKAVIERFAEYPNIERAVLFGSRAREKAMTALLRSMQAAI